MEYLEEYKRWCEGKEFDEETKKELLEIEKNLMRKQKKNY